MRVSEVMIRDVCTISPEDTVMNAARVMDEHNLATLPVCDGDSLLGVLTDRDIATRAVTAGRSPRECTVEQVISAGVDFCFEDDDAEELIQKMADRRIPSIPVLDRQHRFVGIVALGDRNTESDLPAGAIARDKTFQASPPGP